VNLSPLNATFPEDLASIASKGLVGKLSLLDAMFTENKGEAKVQCLTKIQA
jgi:hypothetical protein